MQLRVERRHRARRNRPGPERREVRHRRGSQIRHLRSVRPGPARPVGPHAEARAGGQVRRSRRGDLRARGVSRLRGKFILIIVQAIRLTSCFVYS